jgi:hypothetical protein
MFLRASVLILNSSNVIATGGSAGSHANGRNGTKTGTCTAESGLGGSSSGAGGAGGVTVNQDDLCTGGGGAGGDGSAGGVGRVHIEYETLTGDTDPTSDKTQIPEMLLWFVPLAFIIPKLMAIFTNPKNKQFAFIYINSSNKKRTQQKISLKAISDRAPP